LVESNIYPLALFPDNPGILFNYSFINQSSNKLASLLPQDSLYADYIKVIYVPETHPGKLLRVVMSAEENMALGYLHLY
jgi:hypothetical protein